jgi:invasion protein IalB
MKVLAFTISAAVCSIAACSSAPNKLAEAPAAPQPVAVAPAPAPAVTSVAGNWLLTVNSQAGANDTNLVLAQTGADLTGRFESSAGSANVKGSVAGKDIKITFPFSGQGVELTIDFIGTTDGQTMSGRAVFGGYGEGTFSGKRQ